MKNVFIGIIVGIISGLFSAGGGLILVPIFLYVIKLDDKQSRATSLFCILPMVIVTAIIYGKNNYLDWNMGLKCAIGGIVGGVIGAKLLNNIPAKYLKILFIFFLIYAGVSIIIK